MLVSKVASETPSAQGGLGVAVDRVNVTTPRTAMRVPVAPAPEKGRLAEEVSPAVTVNGVALPIVVPLALRNEIVPVQEVAVPPDALAAKFTTLISAVSVAPSPTGGKVKSRVPVVVCANGPDRGEH